MLFSVFLHLNSKFTQSLTLYQSIGVNLTNTQMFSYRLFILISLAMIGLSACSENATAPTELVDVTIESSPQAAEGTNGVVYRFSAVSDMQPAGLRYEWNFDDGTVVELNDQAFVDHAFSEFGLYSVRVRVFNERGDFSEDEYQCNIRSNDQPTIDMVELNGGTFSMGSTVNFQEGPVHEATITRKFRIATTELNQYAFKLLMGYNPSWFRGDSLPVEQVSWFEAIEYCNRRSIREGLQPCYTIGNDTIQCDFDADGYRLPTEAEWEYACRAGTTTHYYTGDAVQPLVDCQSFVVDEALSEAGWWCRNSDLRTHIPGQKTPNAFGLFDMHGNVSEWVWDWFSGETYANSSRIDPVGPDFATERVTRGGSWDVGPFNCRSGSRQKPRHPDRKMHTVGIRLVQTIQ